MCLIDIRAGSHPLCSNLRPLCVKTFGAVNISLRNPAFSAPLNSELRRVRYLFSFSFFFMALTIIHAWIPKTPAP